MIKIPIKFLWILAVLSFYACGLNKSASIVIDNKIGAKLPANAKVSIYMTPSELNKRYECVFCKGLVSQPIISLDDGKRMQHAAIKVFSSLFKEVSPNQESQKLHLVARINGTTNYNRFWGAYEADATVLLYSGNGTLIGTFNAKATETSNPSDTVGLENAYIKAFEKISSQMLENEILSKYFINGFTDELY
jgi:hypothetical protein